MQFKAGKYLFKPRGIPTLMSTGFIVLFVILGRWQWQRADYKELLHDRYIQGEKSEPLTAEMAAVLGKDINSFPIVIDGHFDNAHNILLDNQVENAVAGFQVLTPFITAQDKIVLVDRGWLPLGKDRQHFTAIPALEEKQFHISGKVYFPSEKQFVLREDNYSNIHWPLLVQKLDSQAIGGVLGVELAPFVVRLDTENIVEIGEQLPRHWQFMVIGSEKSRGYSFQWFGMAIVLMGFYIFFSTEKVKAND